MTTNVKIISEKYTIIFGMSKEERVLSAVREVLARYGYACPDSKGKMKKVAVSPAVAKAGLAQTNAALAPKKPAGM